MRQIISAQLIYRNLLGLSLIMFACFSAAYAQTTSFTYQGGLNDGATVANGTYNMQFALFNADAGGNQIGSTQSALVSVTNGVFTVQLNFGATAFADGGLRYLQITINGATLSPRQQITSTPYSLRSISAANADALSSACAGCVTNAQINSVDGSKVTGTVSNAANAVSSTTATNFSGSLSGDVTGTQSATVVSNVGGKTSTQISTSVTDTTNATPNNTANTIVKRDTSGNFSAGTITANLTGNASTATTATNATNFTGSLAGDVTGTQSATVVSKVGGKTSAQVATSVTDTTNATSANTPNTIVKRDASGNISFNGFLRSAAATFDHDCVDVDGVPALVGVNNNNGTCNVILAVGTVDGFPLIFTSRSTFLGGTFSSDGSGVATITQPGVGDFAAFFVVSAGPFGTPPQPVNTNSANSSQSIKSEGDVKPRSFGAVSPKP